MIRSLDWPITCPELVTVVSVKLFHIVETVHIAKHAIKIMGMSSSRVAFLGNQKSRTAPTPLVDRIEAEQALDIYRHRIMRAYKRGKTDMEACQEYARIKEAIKCGYPVVINRKTLYTPYQLQMRYIILTFISWMHKKQVPYNFSEYLAPKYRETIALAYFLSKTSNHAVREIISFI